jgi:hypothetical protein
MKYLLAIALVVLIVTGANAAQEEQDPLALL